MMNESASEFKSIIDRIPDLVYELDQEGNIIFINKAISKYGYTVDELLGKNILDLIYPDDRSKARYRVSERRKGERRTTAFELRLVTSAGAAVPFEIIEAEGIYQAGEAGEEQFVRTQGVAREITERKRAEEELRRSEERYKNLVEQQGEGICVVDADEQITFANPAAERIFGVLPGELIRKNLDNFLQPEYLLLVKEQKEHSWDQSRRSYEIEITTLKNEKRYLLITSTLNFDGQENFVEAFWILRDITQRRMAEQENARLATIVRQTDEGILIFNLDGSVRYVNPSFERITGYSNKDMTGQSLQRFKGGKEGEEFYRNIRNMLLRGETWSGRISEQKKDGTPFVIETILSPILDNSGWVINYVAVIRDVTREIELERQLRVAQQMKAAGQLAGGIAHEFNNILTVIIGYAELMMDPDLPETLSEGVLEIKRSAERAASLTQQLLAFGRKQIRRPVVLNLNEMLAELSKILEMSLDGDIEMNMDLEPELAAIKADKDQLKQVIINLTDNAIEAMAAGGRLTIKTENLNLDEVYCAGHQDVEPGVYVSLLVRDSGIGMDEQTREKIFNPFFTTKEIGAGTGLSLAAVYGIVKQSHGHIWVSSKPEKGTTIQIIFPSISPKSRE